MGGNFALQSFSINVFDYLCYYAVLVRFVQADGILLDVEHPIIRVNPHTPQRKLVTTAEQHIEDASDTVVTTITTTTMMTMTMTMVPVPAVNMVPAAAAIANAMGARAPNRFAQLTRALLTGTDPVKERFTCFFHRIHFAKDISIRRRNDVQIPFQQPL